MPINKKWHLKNRMPKNATLKQRIKWHKEHAKHCSCWPVPAKLQSLISKAAKK